MSRFTEILLVSPLPDGKNWVIKKDFGYEVGNEGSGEVIDVPMGFATDFASVPRLLWWLFPKWGKYGNAAVIHDYLYWDQRYSRMRSDDIFLEAMKVLEVDQLTAWILYQSVSWFGWLSWKSNRERKKEGHDRVLRGYSEKITDWKGTNTLKARP